MCGKKTVEYDDRVLELRSRRFAVLLCPADVEQFVRFDEPGQRPQDHGPRDLKDLVVLAPMPIASDSTAVAVKSGLRRSSRSP